jgi:hypothetical protein
MQVAQVSVCIAARLYEPYASMTQWRGIVPATPVTLGTSLGTPLTLTKLTELNIATGAGIWLTRK